MRDYVAWLNGTSVARGTLREVEAKAREIAATPLWRARHEDVGLGTVLRITRGPRQLFAKSVVLSAPAGAGV